MTAHIAIHGRLGGDPVERTSQAGNVWASATVAVPLGGEDDDAVTWFGIIAFGRVAETLCRHGKGDLISASGRLQLNRWRDRNGNDREGLQVVAEAIISARSVRPGGGRRSAKNSDTAEHALEDGAGHG